MNQRFLNPTNDVAFKKVFGREEHKNILISFLNSILRLEEKEWIQDIEFLKSEQVPIIDGGRRVIFDVKCRDLKGNEFIVEMQNRNVPDFAKRMQYYAAHSYVSQIGKGSSYVELKPIILVAVSNFTLFDSNTDPISFHKTLETTTYENHMGDLSYVFVELPKFKKEEDEIKTIEDQWLFYFKNAETAEDIPESVVAQEVREAYETLEQFKWDTHEYDHYVKANMVITEEQRGKEVKFQEGLKKGKAEGIKEGGDQMAQQIALSLLRQNIALEIVEQSTGLSVEELQTLKKK